MGEVVRDAARAHGKPWGLRLHNVEWMIWDRYAERFPTWHPTRRYLKAQASKIREAEAQLIAQADVVFTITPVDKERALELAPNANVIVAPAGVEPPFTSPSGPLQVPFRLGPLQVAFRSPSGPLQVIMASTYRWIHNVDALRWFVDRVWPLVHAKVPEAEFHVLGKDPPSWLAEYAQQGVVVRGFVDDLMSVYAGSAVSVAPLFVGSGMRLKIIEAMVAGLPVVATTISAEGIELSEAEGLFRKDSPEDTAQVIIGLLRDRQEAQRIGQCAQEAVLRRYTWRSSVSIMAAAYERLISGRE
jgi:glycosyltransferase involved in cell wall biosynthesis